MILLIDNYDSFVHNLARHVVQLGYEAKVVRNDEISIDDIKEMAPDKIIISPGPCDPDAAGISLEVISKLSGTVPILGICLGHQAIGQAFGAKVVRASKPVHGKSSYVNHNKVKLFSKITTPLRVGRYHSLIVDKTHLPKELEITAESKDGEIMALQHKKLPVYGVQFHPESVNSDCGYELLRNFLSMKGEV